VELVDLTPAIGSEVRGLDLVAGLDDAGLAELERILADRGLLVFRDCAITPAQQSAFAARLGELQLHPAYDVVDGAPGVTILESTPEVPTKIEAWHTDMTFSPAPPKITMLHAQVLPPSGGDTLYASMTAAYDGLSEPLKSWLDGLVAVHDFRLGFRESLAEPGGAERLADAVAANPPVEHPVVVAHPVTGRRGLYVNSLFTARIRGLAAHESRALLDLLFAHVIEPEYTVRLKWAPGTLAIWDNRCTQHKPVNDYFPAHRRMHRVTVEGERPAAAA
jgi:taurine dioxygenase